MAGNKILTRLFADPVKGITGRIVGRPSAGVYLVRDNQGRQYRAESDAEWRIGSDWVVVYDGRVVGRAARGSSPQTFSV